MNIPEPVQDQASPFPMVQGMRVSVIVPTFNRANYIAECLDSLLAQTMPALEIIVIDDGSEDGTAGLLHMYEQRIRYIRKENGGKPTAVNLGLSLAQGELIWVFDDDDVALPNAIADRVKLLQSRPDAGFVYSPHYYGTNSTDGTILKGHLHTMPEHDQGSFFLELMKGCFFHLATALVRADVYSAVGGFDTELLSSEDYDMQLRLVRSFSAAYCPEPTFIFRQHTGPRGAKAIRYAGVDRSMVFRKFDQRIGQKLRLNLPLGNYLVPRRGDSLTSDEMFHALLGRITIMASKACLHEAFEDMGEIIKIWPQNRKLTAFARTSIAQSVCTGYAVEAIEYEWSAFKSLLSRLPRMPGRRSVLAAIAVGLFRLAKGYPAGIPVRWSRAKHAGYVLFQILLPGRAR